MKTLLHKIKNTIKIRKIERSEPHFSWGQTTKILMIGFFFVLGYIVLVPPRLGTNGISELMTFQFRGSAQDRGATDAQIHGAADRWGYLFDNASNQVFSGAVTPSQDITSSPLLGSTKTRYARIITGDIQIPNYYVAVETLVFSPDLAIYYLEHFLEGDRSKLVVADANGYTPKDCTSPSGEAIVHGDFIIAYQQRTDVTTVCNVEKRYCNDGTLLGSYLQEYCDEKTAYAYEKIEPIAYNINTPSEYVQPSEPENAFAEFSSQGKINAPLDPTTRWEPEPAGAKIVTTAGIAQTIVVYKDCRAPRNEKVLNGQFVRAYKENKGYFNRPCQVEIRMCVDGHLKGTFKNKACAYTGVSYEMAN